jgi:solute carrier family 25 phosphate transporter 23/24/25/41
LILLSACLQVAPSLAINYAAYETLRSSWLAKTELSSPTVPMSLACGSLAGLVSSTATFPLDLVRRRLQLRGQGGVGGAGQQPATFRGMFRSVVQVSVRGREAAATEDACRVPDIA